MIDKINKERKDHILTIEDPIEFVHQHQGCLVNQREVHGDTQSFTNALRAALREDPDIVLIGEMRDLETVEAALRIAETGHLTFGTLHTNSAAQTINRIIDVFPSHQQSQIRTQLSLVLEGIVCQALCPKIGGGRVVSLEIMIPTPAIRNLIREDKIHQIYSAMQTGQEKYGMQTANQSLATLYQKKQITLETAMEKSSNRDELQEMINRGAGVVAGAGLGRPGAPAAAGGWKVKHGNDFCIQRTFTRAVRRSPASASPTRWMRRLPHCAASRSWLRRSTRSRRRRRSRRRSRAPKASRPRILPSSRGSFR